MIKHKFTLSKEERLCGIPRIARLFEAGNSFLVYPLKIVWMPSESEQPTPVVAGFTVSRKLFRKAVDRNLVKRRMREAYRLHKEILYSSCENRKITVMFIYIAPVILPWKNIEKAFRTFPEKFSRKNPV